MDHDADDAERSSAPAGVEIHLLGAFRVVRDGREVTPAGLAGQLLRLVASRGNPVHVDDLADALWPSGTALHGRRRLRNVLSRLRDAAGEVVERREDCVLLARDVRVDLHAFADDAERALAALREGHPGAARQARRVLARARHELLPEDRYATWAADGRARHHRRVLALLDRLADHVAASGDGREAARLLLEAIDLEPYDEDRYLRVATLLVADGRRGLAATLLDAARHMLEDLDVPPTPELQDLQAELRRPTEISLPDAAPRIGTRRS